MQKATPERARLHNTQLVLKTIYDRGQISRAEVARVTRLTRPTVSDVVAGLMRAGLVEEVGYAPSSGGRRAILLRVVDDSRHLVGIDLSREDFRGALINLRGDIRHRVDLPLEGRDGDAALALVYDLIDALVGSASSRLLGLGIGAPGLVDSANGVMHQAVNLNWRDVPLRELLHKRYNLPVYIANDCQVAALGEYTFGSNEDIGTDMVVIKVGWGIGAGIVLDGRLLHGNPLGAGEIGHVVMVENGRQCACGNFGCLETVASSRAIIQSAQTIARQNPNSPLSQYASKPERITLKEVCQGLGAGDEGLRQVIHEAGRSLGVAAANLVGVIGSCRILIAGSVECFGEQFLDIIRQEMSKRCLSSLARDTEVGFASSGSDIVLLGSSALLLSHELGVL